MDVQLLAEPQPMWRAFTLQKLMGAMLPPGVGHAVGAEGPADSQGRPDQRAGAGAGRHAVAAQRGAVPAAAGLTCRCTAQTLLKTRCLAHAMPSNGRSRFANSACARFMQHLLSATCHDVVALPNPKPYKP